MRLRRAFVRYPTTGYLATVTLLTLAILAVPLLLAGDRAAASLVVILAVVPASDLAITIVNRGVTKVLGPPWLSVAEVAERLEARGGAPRTAPSPSARVPPSSSGSPRSRA